MPAALRAAVRSSVLVLILILYVPCVAPMSQNARSVSILFFQRFSPSGDKSHSLRPNDNWSLGSFPANGNIGRRRRKVKFWFLGVLGQRVAKGEAEGVA